jgi:cytochrome c biogenesis protein
MGEEKKNFIDRIVDPMWDFFASVKLAIVVFAGIGLTSIVGTIIEQNAAPQTNLKILTELLGRNLAPGAYDILFAMGFMDMYGSWWFVGLLMLFTANLLICSLDRLPTIWRIVRKPQEPLKEQQLTSRPIRKEVTLKGTMESNKEKVLKALRSLGFKKVEEAKEEDGVQYYSQKGQYGRLGVYVTHISIIIILAGAVVGTFFGFKGFLNLPEGASYSVAFARRPLSQAQVQERNFIFEAVQTTGGDLGAAAMRLGVSTDRLTGRMRAVGLEPLGFIVTNEDFDVLFYGNSDMAKEYTSLLTVTDGGREVMRKWIEVNTPLKYRGYTFYQSSYGPMNDPDQNVFVFRVAASGAQGTDIRVRQGETFSVPGTGIEASVAEFSPALTFDETGRPITYDEMMNNPAVRLSYTDGGKERSKWILKRYPSTWVLPNNQMVQLVDIWGAQYTGLQVRKDPGVWVVYLGCAFMSIGLYVAFFMGHRRIWVRLASRKGSTQVLIGASAHKGKEGFERQVDRSISLLSEGGKQ